MLKSLAVPAAALAGVAAGAVSQHVDIGSGNPPTGMTVLTVTVDRTNGLPDCPSPEGWGLGCNTPAAP